MRSDFYLFLREKRRSLLKSIRVGDPKYLKKKFLGNSRLFSSVESSLCGCLFAFALLLYVRAMTEKRTMERRRKDDEENNE